MEQQQYAGASGVSDADLWACARRVVEQHGAEAMGVVQRRMRDLAAERNSGGLDVWIAIAERLESLAEARLACVG